MESLDKYIEKLKSNMTLADNKKLKEFMKRDINNISINIAKNWYDSEYIITFSDYISSPRKPVYVRAYWNPLAKRLDEQWRNNFIYDLTETVGVLSFLQQDKRLLERLEEIKQEEILAKKNEQVDRLIKNIRISKNQFSDSNVDMQNVKVYTESIDLIPVINTIEDELSFKIGQDKLYKVKNMSMLCEALATETIFEHGKKLSFKHTLDAFTPSGKVFANWITNFFGTINFLKKDLDYQGRSANSKMTLGKEVVDSIMSCIEKGGNKFEIDGVEVCLLFATEEPNISFRLEILKDDMCKIKYTGEHYCILEGTIYTYLLNKNLVYKCKNSVEQEKIDILRALCLTEKDEITFTKDRLDKFAKVLPSKIWEDFDTSKLSEEDKDKYIPQKLGVKVMLDLDEYANILANIKFCYKNTEFNPLDKKVITTCTRNETEETEVINMLRADGFLDSATYGDLVIVDEEKTYDFLTNRIFEYMKKFEVLVTEKFKTKQITKPKITNLGVRVQNNLLELDLAGVDFDLNEMQEVLTQYRLKKKYVKLKDGTFLSLEKNSDLDFLDNLSDGVELDFGKARNGVVKLPANRTLYLDKLLNMLPNTEVSENSEYKEIIQNTQNAVNDEDITLPEGLNGVLRNYQNTGYKWLNVLDRYHFGGILADDMGLGKTLQLIAVLLKYKEECGEENAKPSIVVCPSSLVLNWQNEILKFAPSLKTLVISGGAKQRKEQIEMAPNTDVCITSYDLLKRDIDIYIKQNLCFRYIISDESQYIKNSNTQNFKALKELNGDTKYALTGTPIENSLAELWSIFDYIMPGYLYSYAKFKRDFESPIIKDDNTEKLARLKKMIEPFILRRVKENVLTELPEKTITVLNNEMDEEQKKIYLTYLANAKKELAEAVKTEGFEKSQIKILALLTRLRQICCHPGLFLENYTGESSKLNQCIELVESAIDSGHKILLFSNYSQMFTIIQSELEKKNIKYYKLTGETKVADRVDMVNRFNEDSSIKVFLISLKAGGTGLNLTGADVVIHFDPWWNLSAENQATDRAYRIGQKNNVQVYKLITKNSIEEKIEQLQAKKAQIANGVLDTEEVHINKLSKEEIMSLFE